MEIFASSRDNFYYQDDDSQLHFQREAQGKVASVNMVHAFGPEERGTKTTEALPKEPQAAKVDPSIYDAYVGEYELAPGFSWSSPAEGTTSSPRPPASGNSRSIRSRRRDSSSKSWTRRSTFSVDRTGKVSGLVLHQGGRDLPGKRK